jgi:DUF4097 and DUF4098 domain-containing protein YvlB
MTARTDRRIALSVGIVLAAIFIVCSATSVAGWTIGSTEKTNHEVIPGPVKTLTLDANSGDVTLVASDTDDVVVDSHARGQLHTPTLKVRPEGTHLTVTGGCPNISFGDCSAEIIVRVPANTAVDVDAGSGDIHAQDLSGNVRLRSASGDVSADDLHGFSVQLKSASGDITASHVRAGTVSARTASGDVTLQLSSVPEGVEARTNSGDVAVLVPPGSEMYRVDADTNSGDKTVGVATSSRASHAISAHTNSGDVVVDYGP